MEQFSSPTLVDKESIKDLTFIKPVLFKQDSEIPRKISDAMLLGNTYHTKVSIVFFDDEGLKKVSTTIWAYGSKYLCLKGGIWLPVDHIYDISLV